MIALSTLWLHNPSWTNPSSTI